MISEAYNVSLRDGRHLTVSARAGELCEWSEVKSAFKRSNYRNGLMTLKSGSPLSKGERDDNYSLLRGVVGRGRGRAG